MTCRWCSTASPARPATARRVLDAGYYLSLAGIVTFPRALELKEVAAFVPLDRLLVETDSPYLAPVPHRGTRNEPAHVALVAETVAALRGERAGADPRGHDGHVPAHLQPVTPRPHTD